MGKPNMQTVNVVHGKCKYQVEVPIEGTFLDVKEALIGLTGASVGQQKITLKSKVRKDTETLLAAGVKAGTKLLLVAEVPVFPQSREDAALDPKAFGPVSAAPAPKVAPVIWREAELDAPIPEGFMDITVLCDK